MLHGSSVASPRSHYQIGLRVSTSEWNSGHLQSTLSRGIKIVWILVWCLCSRALPTNKQSSHQGPRPAREITGEAATQDADYSSSDMQAKPSQSICTCLTYIREDVQAKLGYDDKISIKDFMH